METSFPGRYLTFKILKKVESTTPESRRISNREVKTIPNSEVDSAKRLWEAGTDTPQGYKEEVNHDVHM